MPSSIPDAQLDPAPPQRILRLWVDHPIFGPAGQRVCSQLANRYPATLVPRRAVVVQPGQAVDMVHVLLSGCVRIYRRTADGRELVVCMMASPAVFGDIEILAGATPSMHVSAVQSAWIAQIPADHFTQILEEYPQILQAHLKHIAALTCVLARGHQQLLCTLEQRLANLVLTLADVDGHLTDDGFQRISIPLDQEALASALGSVRRSIASTLARWRREGYIDKRGRHLYVCNATALEQMAAAVRGSLLYRVGMPLFDLDSSQRRTTATVEVLKGTAIDGTQVDVASEVFVGSGASSAILVPGSTSTRNCRIFRGRTGERFWVEDLGPGTTQLNGRPIQRAVLRSGDVIRVGPAELVVHLADVGDNGPGLR